MRALPTFSSLRSNLSRTRMFEVIVVIAICLSATDVVVARMYTIGFNLYGTDLFLKLLLFSALILSSVFSLNLASYAVNNRVSSYGSINSGGLRTTSHLIQVQVVIVSIFLCVVLFEVVIKNSYHVPIAISIIAISYSVGIFSLLTLTVKFFKWLMVNHNKLVLFFLLSSLSLTINLVFTASYVNSALMSRPLEAGFFYGGSGYNMAANPSLREGYFFSTFVSFILTWLATAFLMRELGRPLKKVTFWLLVSSLGVYFVFQFFSLAPNLLDEYLARDPIFYGFFITSFSFITKIIGGILFGLSFALMARSLPAGSILRKFIIVSSLGFALFFTANQAIVLVFLPFPPYGLIAASFTGIAAYLIMVGIYTSAISMAQDAKLRQEVRKYTSNRLSLLENIAMAETETSITNRVLDLSNRYAKELKEASGVEPNLSHEEIESYIYEALKEVNASRLASSANSYLVSQYHLIKSWWISYLDTLQGIHCDMFKFPTSGNTEGKVGGIIFLPGYMGTRGLQSYSFEVTSGAGLLFPIMLESLSITINNGERSVAYGFKQIELDTSQYEVRYDDQPLGYLSSFKSESDKITFECVVTNTEFVRTVEVEFVGYWIFLRTITMGEHVVSLKRKTDSYNFLSYKVLAKK